jgi:hypothetical protein
MQKFSVSVFILLALAAGLSSCSSCVKEKANKAGNAAGEIAGEFVEGAVQGATDAFDVKVNLPKNLQEKGIRFGKSTVSNDSSGTDNLLTVYVIFEKDFEGTLTAKVFDGKGLEMGRSTQSVKGKTNETQFVEFHFDQRTNIDSNCKVVVE